MSKSRFLAATISLAFAALSARVVLADPLRWEQLADDLQTVEVSVGSGFLFRPDLTLVRTSLRRYAVGVVTAESLGRRSADVRQLSELSLAAVGINANFFDEQTKPLGLIIRRGNLLHGVHRGGSTLTGIFFATRTSIGIAGRADFSPKEVVDGIQAGPRLLVDGSPTQGLRSLSQSSRRAGVCIDSSRRLIFYIASSVFGITLDDLQSTLTRPGIDCRHALNLDGGGSAQLYVSNQLPGAPKGLEPRYISGTDEVPVMLGLFARDEGR